MKRNLGPPFQERKQGCPEVRGHHLQGIRRT